MVPILTFFITLIWVFGVMGHFSINVDSMVMSLPIYVAIVISIGYSIHIFNFFKRSFSGDGDRRAAVLHAVEETGWPIFFTSATTIGALCSFYFVPIRRVRWMGLSSAAVVVAAYILIMTLAPALLSFGKNRHPRKEYDHQSNRGEAQT